MGQRRTKKYRKQKGGNNNPNNIQIVIIVYNNLTYLKQFMHNIKKYPNPIIIMDNQSTYPKLLTYYKKLKKDLENKVDIRMLDQNYGHTVWLKLKSSLPDIFILSDPDIEINSKMPINFAEILLNISNKYKASKVGSALDISDHDKFIPDFGSEKYNHEKQFWINKINDTDYELYNAMIDTTLCLVNFNYDIDTAYGLSGNHIRIAGDFTAKHLPWYNNYMKDNIPSDEMDHLIKTNVSSTILQTNSVKKHLGINR